MENGKKWYQKTFVVILLLVLFAPAGIFLLWKYTSFGRTAKIIFTAVFGFWFLILFIGSCDGRQAVPPETLLPSPAPAASSPAETDGGGPSSPAFSPAPSPAPSFTPAPTVSAASTPAPSSGPASTPAPEAPETGLTLISVTSPVGRNETAAVKVKGAPNTPYDIAVHYSSGVSSAAGLEKKTSGSDGAVSWTWKVGGRTKPGDYYLTVSGAGESLRVPFTVK